MKSLVLVPFVGLGLFLGLHTTAPAAPAAPVSRAAADACKVDTDHSFVVFKVKHANASYTLGRFNNPTGTFTWDAADPAKSSFNIEIQVANVDTHQDKRDAHLKSPDFFNAKQYPTISFKSTSVKGSGDKLEVTGQLSLHGVTKEITVPIELVGNGEAPPGMKRTGIETMFSVKMTDFGMKAMPGMVGDDVKLMVEVEGTH